MSRGECNTNSKGVPWKRERKISPCHLLNWELDYNNDKDHGEITLKITLR